MMGENDTWCMTVGPTPVCACETVPCLRARDYKDPQVVFIPRVKGMFWNGDEIVGTLTVNNANGAQRMPDKDNFGCILVEVERACV